MSSAEQVRSGHLLGLRLDCYDRQSTHRAVSLPAETLQQFYWLISST